MQWNTSSNIKKPVISPTTWVKSQKHYIVREASHKRIYTRWFNLCEVPEQSKLFQREKYQKVVAWKGRGY